MTKKIGVLVVDDSAVIRNLLTSIINTDPKLQVVGTAIDPFAARRKLLELKPDVLTLDIEMPRMDGVTFLRKIMTYRPTPCVVISSLTKKNTETYFRALEAGAVAVMPKPAINTADGLRTIANEICAQIKEASIANLKAYQPQRLMVTRKNSFALAKTTHHVLAIASSTGGTEALKVVLQALPPDIPGTVVVQHMPPVFTSAYANRLNELCSFEVREAVAGDRVLPGRVLLAPGNFHMELVRNGAYYEVKLNQNRPENSVRPSADVLMRSVAKWAGRNAIGVVLTGMGKDGALGLGSMRKSGAYTIAQDESSCVVFGMPKASIEAGAICSVQPLDRIADEIMQQLMKMSLAG